MRARYVRSKPRSHYWRQGEREAAADAERGTEIQGPHVPRPTYAYEAGQWRVREREEQAWRYGGTMRAEAFMKSRDDGGKGAEGYCMWGEGRFH